MNNKKILFYIISISIFLAIYFFITYPKVNNTEYYINNMEKTINYNVEKESQFAINKKVSWLSKELSKLLHKQFIVFYYNDADCNTCVYKGFECVKLARNIFKNKLGVAVYTTNHYWHNEVVKVDYDGPVIIDKNDRLIDELKHVHTPFLILIDSTLTVKNIYPILSWNNESNAVILNNLISTNKKP